jgi:rfaE bifunctional protein nucleotidyltransferase chain/domain
MTRAVLLAGCLSPPSALTLREFAVLPVPRYPGRSFGHWQRLAARLGVEPSASWLVVVRGAAALSDEVKAGFRGCLEEVEPALLRVAARKLDREASRSRVVVDFQTASRRCERIRRSGRRLVFTNGVFDLFHVGHLRLLQAARALGDALVVGVNSDESARRLKGRSRPAVPQFARAETVAGIREVDLCVIFEQADPRELLRAVRPDILVKGSEYSLREVVGRELVESWGGRVQRIPHVPGWSSTSLLRDARRV